MVRELIELIRFRNTHPAFAGEFLLPACGESELVMEWKAGADFARLKVNLPDLTATIEHSTAGGPTRFAVGPATASMRNGL